MDCTQILNDQDSTALIREKRYIGYGDTLIKVHSSNIGLIASIQKQFDGYVMYGINFEGDDFINNLTSIQIMTNCQQTFSQ